MGRANRRADTKPEVAVRSALHRRGFRFRKDLPIRADGLTVRPDIVFTRRRIAVFIDGCFWHSCPDHGSTPRSNPGYWGPKLATNAERDRRVNRALADAGWIVFRAWEHEHPDDIVDHIAALFIADRVDPTTVNPVTPAQ